MQRTEKRQALRNYYYYYAKFTGLVSSATALPASTRGAFLSLVGLSVILAGCGGSGTSNTSDLDTFTKSMVVSREKLREQLKDPDSAKFQNVKGLPMTTDDGTKLYYFCGEVNARNALGGYTGYTCFIATPVGATLEGVAGDFGSGWNQRCQGEGREGSAAF